MAFGRTIRGRKGSRSQPKFPILPGSQRFTYSQDANGDGGRRGNLGMASNRSEVATYPGPKKRWDSWDSWNSWNANPRHGRRYGFLTCSKLVGTVGTVGTVGSVVFCSETFNCPNCPKRRPLEKHIGTVGYLKPRKDLHFNCPNCPNCPKFLRRPWQCSRPRIRTKRPSCPGVSTGASHWIRSTRDT